jgi:hypothetical protein
MKLALLSIFLALPLMAGCAKSTASTPPLAPGFSNSADQTLGTTLAAADAFYNKLQTDQAAGTFKPTAAEVTALNALQLALSAANPIYLAYHNGTGSLAAAQDAVNKVSAAQTNTQVLITGGK